MQVTVKFFSFFRHISGADQLSVDLPEGTTLGELLNSLSEKLDSSSLRSERAMMMVNHKNAFPETILREGDDILLLPLFGGG